MATAWPPPSGQSDRNRSMPTSMSVRQAARVQLLVRRVLGRGVLDERLDHLVVGHVPVRSDLPVLAIPGLDAAGAGALVIGAGELDRLELALEAELLDAVRRDVEVLETPAHLLAGHRLVAEARLRGADRLDAEHGVDQAAHVEHIAGVLPLGDALALVIQVLLEILVQLEP